MNSMILTAIGSDQPGIVSELSGIIIHHGGNIEESRMSQMGSDFAIIMLIKVDPKWYESLVVSLQTIKGLSVTTKRTKSSTIATNENCQILLNGADNEGIINVLSNYLNKKNMNILDMETYVSNAPVTGTPLFNLKAIVAFHEEKKISDIKSDLDEISKRLGIEIVVFESEPFTEKK